MEFLTQPNIMFALGIIGIIFTVYNYFRNPQIKSDKTDSILELEIKQLKLDILALKETITNLKDNHLHSLQVAIETTNTNLNNLTIQVAKLSTVIDERTTTAESGKKSLNLL